MSAEAAASARWPKGLLALTLALAALAPLALWSGRVPGLGEFDYLIFYRLLFYNDFYNSLAMLAALLIALAIRPLRMQVVRIASWASLHPVKLSILTFIALAIAARVVYQGFPLAMDEYAPLLQARIFAHGNIAITYPLELLDRMVVPGFQGSFILVNHATGQAMSGYWPGLALMMSPFALFGGEWLLNPLLGAAGLWLIGDLAKQASGSAQTTGWAMLAALACPQFTINAMSYYAMTSLLTFNLLFLWLLLRPGWKSAMLAGVVGSIALVMHNPAPHTLFALPCIVWLLWSNERRHRILPLAVGYLPITLLLCLGWPLLTSSMGLRPIDVSASNGEFLASWLSKLQNTFILPNPGILMVRSYAAWKTLIWAAPGLVLLAFIVKPKSAIQRLLLAAILITFAFYLFFPYDQGHGWGYRYIHPAWGLIPIVGGIFAASGNANPFARKFISTAVCAGILATPAFLYTTHSTIMKSVEQELPLSGNGQTIAFVTAHAGLYTVDLVRNYPKDSGSTITMLSQGMETDQALVKTLSPDATLLVSDQRGSAWAIPRALPKRETE